MMPFFSIFLFLCLTWLAAPPAFAATFNVKDFGAVGNGTTDDTASIQRALNTASSSSGNIVFFPTGKYRFSNLQIRNVALVGQAKDLVTLEGMCSVAGATASMANLSMTIKPGGGSAVVDDVSEDSSYTNISFSGGGFTPGSLLNIRSANNRQLKRNSVVDGCEFIRGVSHISANRCDQLSIRNSTFLTPFGHSITVTNSKQVSIASSNFKTNLNNFISTAVWMNGCSFASITKNRVELYGKAVFSHRVSDLTVDGNQFLKISRFGVDVDTSKGTVSNNTIQMESQNSSAGIVARTLNFISILNNHISDCGSGIGVYSFGCDIKGNTIERATQIGIGIVGNLTCTIDSNTLRDCGRFRPPSSVIHVGQIRGVPVVTNNTYTGGKNNLEYFIRSETPSPPLVLFGNTTTTLLPNRIKP